MGRHLLGDPGSDDYFSKEAWLNELSVELLADGTKKALAIVTLDSEGNPQSFQNLTSKDNDPVEVEKEGTINQLFTSDQETRNLLNSILKEMKKMNLHMQVMTDNCFNNTEVET